MTVPLLDGQLRRGVLPALLNSIGGLGEVVFNGASLQPFDFWRSSRMLSPTISITEFPYFSFLFADLHPHMMAIPFSLLAMVLALGIIASHMWPEEDRAPRGVRRETLASKDYNPRQFRGPRPLIRRLAGRFTSTR